MANTDRQLSFTIAASSFGKPVIGPVAKALKSIPVSRPEDHKIKGKGKLVFISTKDIKGEDGVDFVKDTEKFKEGFSITVLNVSISCYL